MTVSSLVVNGSTTLYHIAAQQYNDTTDVVSILQNNDLPSPFIVLPLEIALVQNPPALDGQPVQPKPGGTGLSFTPSYPFKVTTTINERGLTTLQYATGNIVSQTSATGNKAGVTPPLIKILNAVFTVTVKNLQPTSFTADWTTAITDPTLTFRVEFKASTDALWKVAGITQQLTFRVGGLSQNTIYQVHVIPFNKLGDSVALAPATSFITPVFQT